MPQIIEKSELDVLCERIITGNERIIFTHCGKQFVLLSMEEFQFFEALEDHYDNELADAALAEMEEREEKPIPYEQIRQDLGLE